MIWGYRYFRKHSYSRMAMVNQSWLSTQNTIFYHLTEKVCFNVGYLVTSPPLVIHPLWDPYAIHKYVFLNCVMILVLPLFCDENIYITCFNWIETITLVIRFGDGSANSYVPGRAHWINQILCHCNILNTNIDSFVSFPQIDLISTPFHKQLQHSQTKPQLTTLPGSGFAAALEVWNLNRSTQRGDWWWFGEKQIKIPDAQCMVYLPTFTINFGQM